MHLLSINFLCFYFLILREMLILILLFILEYSGYQCQDGIKYTQQFPYISFLWDTQMLLHNIQGVKTCTKSIWSMCINLLKVFILWSVTPITGLPNRIFLYFLQVAIADNNSLSLSIVVYRFWAILSFHEKKAIWFLLCMMTAHNWWSDTLCINKKMK
jgi:hypothetical protein